MTLEVPHWLTLPSVPQTVSLAAVAALGYLIGRRGKGHAPAPRCSEEIERASQIAQQLEEIAGNLRGDLALHRTQVERFKKQLRAAAADDDSEAWRRLREEAEAMLAPTLELVSQISTAYDKIRQQSQALANYTGGRIDPTTGLSNSRALEEQLDVCLRGHGDAGHVCSVAVVSVESATKDQNTARDELLRQAGKTLAQQLRGTDFAARYGMGELVVVMPRTSLSGATVFGRRLRATMEVAHGLRVSCGLAEALPGDTAKSLLARADSALYSARASKPGSLFVHTGATIRPDPTRDRNEEHAPADAERPAEAPV